MNLPASHDWPASLHAANAVEQLAHAIHDQRVQFSREGKPWESLSTTTKTMYRDLATRMLAQLGAPQSPDLKLESLDRRVARAFEVVRP